MFAERERERWRGLWSEKRLWLPILKKLTLLNMLGGRQM